MYVEEEEQVALFVTQVKGYKLFKELYSPSLSASTTYTELKTEVKAYLAPKK